MPNISWFTQKYLLYFCNFCDSKPHILGFWTVGPPKTSNMKMSHWNLWWSFFCIFSKEPGRWYGETSNVCMQCNSWWLWIHVLHPLLLQWEAKAFDVVIQSVWRRRTFSSKIVQYPKQLKPKVYKHISVQDCFVCFCFFNDTSQTPYFWHVIIQSESDQIDWLETIISFSHSYGNIFLSGASSDRKSQLFNEAITWITGTILWQSSSCFTKLISQYKL